MSMIHDDLLDLPLQDIVDTTENLYICSAEPTTFTEASVTYKLGTKASPTLSSPQDRSGGGREIILSAITDGVVDADGDAAYWCLCDNSESKLLVVQALTAPVTVSTIVPFLMTQQSIGIPDPA